ncbi:MAG: nuclear transport factor 2 family protein [Ferruginibacter sp.]
MIIIKNTLLIFILLSFAVYCNAQKHEESLIIRLENAEKEAILKGDTIALMKLMSAQIVVQNPENTIIKYDQIMDRIKKGKIDYSSFNRTIENIAFIKNIAIVMGSETIVSKSSSPQTDKVNTRRFTNVWMKEKKTWQLTARQATIISIK